MSNIGQAVQVATIEDGTAINFIASGGRLYRISTDLVTMEDVTPANIAIDPAARVYLTPFSNRIAVNDNVNTPWVASNLLASPVVGTKIDYEGDGSPWKAYGPFIVWQGSLFVVVRERNSEGTAKGTPEKRLVRVGWSEPDDPLSGYHQQEDVAADRQAFDNEWDIVENGDTAINALWGTNNNLLYFREGSIGYLNGSLDDLRTTATHDAIDENTGTRTPATIQSFGSSIFFADVEGRVMLIRDNAVTELWLQHRRQVQDAQTRFPDVTARVACAVIVPELDLYLVALWSPNPTATVLTFPTTMYAFKASTGVYNGRWSIGPLDGDKVAVHAMGTLVGPNGELRLCILGKPSQASAGDPVGIYMLDALDANQWHDDGELPDLAITTYRIGISATTIINVDEAVATVTTVPDATDTPSEDDIVLSVTISPTSLSLAEGESRQLTAVVRNPAGHVMTGVAVLWASDNQGVAAVSPTGVVTGGATGGVARIHASASGITSNASTITNTTAPAVVDDVPAAVTITPSPLTLNIGQSRQFAAVVLNASGRVLTGTPVSWGSDAPTVVSIGTTGVANALDSGSANIRATAGSVVSAPAAVTALRLASHYNLALSATHGLGGSQITVRATRVDDNGISVPAAGVLVNWSKVGTGGAFSSSTSLTDANGMASVIFTLGVDPTISYVIIATDSSGLTGSSSTITVDAGAVVDTVPSDWDGGMVEVWDDLGLGIPTPGAEPTGVMLANFTPPITGAFGAPDMDGFSTQVGTLGGTTFRPGTPVYTVLRNEDDTKRIITPIGGAAGQSTIVGGATWVEEHVVTLSLGRVNPATYTATMTYGAIRTTPELPRLVVDLDITHMAPTGGTYAATSWADLAAALWANPDRTFTIPAGLATTENVILRKPAGHGWTVIKTTGTLPARGTIAKPTVAAANNYPVLTQGAGGFAPALAGSQVDGEVPYKLLLQGLRFTVNPGQQTAFSHTGSLVSFEPSGTQLRQQPHRIILDRCCADVPDTSDCNSVITLIGRHMGGIDSYSVGGHDGDSVRGSRDSKAVQFLDGTGPYTLDNWIVAATDEPIETGGRDAGYRQLVTSDVTLLRVCSIKPAAWYDGSLLPVKNMKSNGLYEYKTAERTLARYCIVDHTQYGQQLGYGVQNWSVNQGGGQTWARSQNHTVEYLWMRNVTVLGGIGRTYSNPSLPNAIVRVRHIAATGFGSTIPATDYAFIISGGVHGVDLANITVAVPNAPDVGYPLFAEIGPVDYRDMTWRNLLLRIQPGNYIVTGAGGSPSTVSALGITMNNSVVAGETNGPAYRVNETGHSNQYVGSFDSDLVNAATLVDVSALVDDLLNLKLKNTSPLVGTGDDGNDPGADVTTIHTNIHALAVQAGLG